MKTEVKKEQHNVEGDGYARVLKYLGIFGGAQGLSILLNIIRTKIASKLLGVGGQTVIALSNRTFQCYKGYVCCIREL